MRLILGLLLISLCTFAQACAMFTVVDAEHVYFANNEDCVSAGLVWFVPGKDGRLGRVNVGYDEFPQGSMNERGLCFDCAALPAVPWSPDPSKKDTDNLLDLIMDHCATVDEALALFDQYNCKHLADGQFMFADASGACAVVTWDPRGRISVVRRTGAYLLNTNDRLEWSGLRDQRFVLAERMLVSRPTTTLQECRDILAAIHQSGKDAFTSYSNVFEPKSGTIHLYNLADFENEQTLDLQAELKKGAHRLRLAELFKHGPKVDAMRKAAPRGYETEMHLAPEVLARYAGHYEVSNPAVSINISRDGDRGLLFSVDGQRAAPMFAESQTAFRFRDTFGTLTFSVQPDGTIDGFTLHRPGDSFAKRIAGK